MSNSAGTAPADNAPAGEQDDRSDAGSAPSNTAPVVEPQDEAAAGSQGGSGDANEEVMQLVGTLMNKIKDLEDKMTIMQKDAVTKDKEETDKFKDEMEKKEKMYGGEVKSMKDKMKEDEVTILDMKSKIESMDKKFQMDLWKMEKKLEEDGIREGGAKDDGKGGIKNIKGYDHKNAPKPQMYDYTDDDYHTWNDLLISLLCSFDAQWEEILLHIQGKKAPLTKDDIEDFQKDLAMEKDVYAKCSKILYTTMMQYTKGDENEKYFLGSHRNLRSLQVHHEQGQECNGGGHAQPKDQSDET